MDDFEIQPILGAGGLLTITDAVAAARQPPHWVRALGAGPPSPDREPGATAWESFVAPRIASLLGTGFLVDAEVGRAPSGYQSDETRVHWTMAPGWEGA